MGKRRIFWEVALAIALLIGIVFFVVASSSWMAGLALNAIPTSVDKSIGEVAWKQVTVSSSRCDNPELNDFVDGILKTLLAHVDTDHDFEFVILDDPSINAFALPGGFVAVNRGLLEKATSTEEVAGVLAHEISHVTFRHGVEGLLRSSGRRVIVGLVFGFSDVSVLLSHAASLRELSYQRGQESEADEAAHRILKSAGLSPLGMSRFFLRLQEEGVSIPLLLSTHPDSGERSASALKAAEGFTPSANVPYPDTISCN